MGFTLAVVPGRLGGEPRPHLSKNGVVGCRFSLAVNSRSKTPGGQGRQATEWVSVVVWGPLAEHCCQFLGKGHRVCVVGKLRKRSWEADGQRHQVTEILALHIWFLDRGRSPASSQDKKKENHASPSGKKAKACSLLLVLLLLALCRPALADQPTPRLVIFGLDETASFSMRNRGLTLARQLVARLQPGDVFYLRRITAASYSDRCAVFRLEIPPVLQVPHNKFDRRAWQHYRLSLRRSQLLKLKAMRMLGQLEPVKASHTDVWGFLITAQEIIEAEGKGKRRIIIISSDMKDNVGNSMGLKLDGTEVVVVMWEAGKDPRYAHRLKRAWRRSILKRCHAASLTFLRPEMKFSW